jgi:hypothetical protein
MYNIEEILTKAMMDSEHEENSKILKEFIADLKNLYLHHHAIEQLPSVIECFFKKFNFSKTVNKTIERTDEEKKDEEAHKILEKAGWRYLGFDYWQDPVTTLKHNTWLAHIVQIKREEERLKRSKGRCVILKSKKKR